MTDPQVIFSYLQSMGSHNASDMYITVGKPVTLRTDEGLVTVSGNTMTADDVNEVLNAILTTRQRREYDSEMELNTALDMAEHGRFRVNVMRQRQAPALVIRRIISTIPSFEELRLPSIFGQLAMEKRGLVLLTGMTGSGKSTTLASMVDYRNENEAGHIITIEDPIEYYQIRDREVMEQALSISETGHLCLATIHTNNSYQAIERIVNLFPEDMANQIRLNLSMNLKAIISQRLLPGVDKKLVPAVEIMINQGLVRELIQKGEISKIKEIMEQNVSSGMCTFDQGLLGLFQSGLISEETCIVNSDKPSEMKIKVQQAKLSSQESKGDGEGILAGMDTSVISLRD